MPPLPWLATLPDGRVPNVRLGVLADGIDFIYAQTNDAFGAIRTQNVRICFATNLKQTCFGVECRLSYLVRCKAVVALQGVDALHLVGSKFEVEDVVILGDVRGIAGTGNGDGATLQMPAEEDLIGRFASG